MFAGAPTPYKRQSKCTMEKVGGRFLQELRGGGKCINFIYKIKQSFILALVDSLNSDEITGRFALSSSKLQKHLNFPEVVHSLVR